MKDEATLTNGRHGMLWRMAKSFAGVRYNVRLRAELLSGTALSSVVIVLALGLSRPALADGGTGGPGTTGHFGTFVVANGLKVQTVHVPFKGGAPALTALRPTFVCISRVKDCNAFLNSPSPWTLAIVQASFSRQQ